LMLIAVAAMLGLTGCASQKEPAEQALAAIEKTFADNGATLQKYLPERHAEVSAAIAALREALAKEDYGDVVSDSAEVADSLKRAVAEGRIKQATTRAEMETEWEDLLNTLPDMIAATDRKIAIQGSKPPAGMDKAGWKSLVDSYDAARDGWGKAAAAMTKANFDETVIAGRDARAKIAGIMETLGIKAS
ncbi:MAG: hypothetical protein ACREIB_12265, partial [Pseudomonadota bacterium]